MKESVGKYRVKQKIRQKEDKKERELGRKTELENEMEIYIERENKKPKRAEITSEIGERGR